ncbi:MAG TPA: transcriptional regulator GcvA [Dongiaceae bacterium]|jgi:LysR family glycine cleavage system transcriptional activator|nr:transcriptional regulator GcvA [Dongiaceae bacterium]
MKLPPLKSLYYFAIVAQRGSLVQAAEELHVTHGAISHQIRELEEWLGTPLFRRTGRKLVLTEKGAILARDVKAGFAQLSEAVERTQEKPVRPVVISTLPSFAAKWLVPRLNAFRMAHPTISIFVSATPEVEKLQPGGADIAVRYGYGKWDDLHAERAYQAVFFPVCSPAFLNEHGPLNAPRDLVDLPLLADPDITWEVTDSWRAWFDHAGIGDMPLNIQLNFGTNALMLQAAMDGLGIGLSNNLLAGDDLRAGRLVRVTDVVLPSTAAYYLVRQKRVEPDVLTTLAWLKQELARFLKENGSEQDPAGGHGDGGTA